MPLFFKRNTLLIYIRRCKFEEQKYKILILTFNNDKSQRF